MAPINQVAGMGFYGNIILMKVSIGVCAYNEDQNIKHLIGSLQEQELTSVIISEIIVVASGCTDQTVSIVQRMQKTDPRIKMIIEDRREGKAKAVNLFINASTNELLVLCSADLRLHPKAVEELITTLNEEGVGMVGSRIIPMNNKNTLIGYAVHLQWTLHNLLNQKERTNPKVGEVATFRKIFQRIPPSSAVDEANIEPLIIGQGYQIRYNPKAIVYNKGPETISDFIRQRRRIYAGHTAVKLRQHYQVSTYNGKKILWTLIQYFPSKPRYIIYTLCTIALEIYGRFLGLYDYHFKAREHTIWEISPTTKNLVGTEDTGEIRR